MTNLQYKIESLKYTSRLIVRVYREWRLSRKRLAALNAANDSRGKLNDLKQKLHEDPAEIITQRHVLLTALEARVAHDTAVEKQTAKELDDFINCLEWEAYTIKQQTRMAGRNL